MNTMNDEKLIMFSFQHFQFAGIHAGIQSGHSWVDMAAKYVKYDKEGHMQTQTPAKYFWQWAESDKVVNIRNGGDQDSLIDIVRLVQRADNPFPWEQWREDSSCNDCMTAVSLVVPEHVFAFEEYEYRWVQYNHGHVWGEVQMRVPNENTLTDFEYELYLLIKRTRHAQ